MRIFNKKTARRPESKISLFINLKKFFDMSKIKQNKPVLQRNGIKNSHPYWISES
jgi:hypothetical protein